MGPRTFRTPTALAICCLAVATAGAQVFVVGEKTATADVMTDFSPTRLPLPSDPLTERGRRELLQNLVSEQGFAHRNLPLGAGRYQADGRDRQDVESAPYRSAQKSVGDMHSGNSIRITISRSVPRLACALHC